MSDNKRFDGLGVDLWAARLAGEFELAEEAAQEMSLDDVVYVIVVGTVSNASVKYLDKTDEIKRINTMKISGAKVLSLAEIENLKQDVNLNGLYGQDYEFEDNRQKELSFDSETGEIFDDEEDEFMAEEEDLEEFAEDIFIPENRSPAVTPSRETRFDGLPSYSKQDGHKELDKFLYEGAV